MCNKIQWCKLVQCSPIMASRLIPETFREGAAGTSFFSRRFSKSDFFLLLLFTSMCAVKKRMKIYQNVTKKHLFNKNLAAILFLLNFKQLSSDIKVELVMDAGQRCLVNSRREGIMLVIFHPPQRIQ